MASRYGPDHANKAMEWVASAFLPVTGVAAAYVARCPMTDVCTNLLFNVAPSLAASETIQLPFNCPVVWECVSNTKSTSHTTPHRSSNSVINRAPVSMSQCPPRPQPQIRPLWLLKPYCHHSENMLNPKDSRCPVEGQQHLRGDLFVFFGGFFWLQRCRNVTKKKPVAIFPHTGI